MKIYNVGNRSINCYVYEIPGGLLALCILSKEMILRRKTRKGNAYEE